MFISSMWGSLMLAPMNTSIYIYTDIYTHIHTHTYTAGKPKKQGALITFCLMLGPDFISDTIVVETSDHARLKVAISMNNVFRVSSVCSLSSSLV